MNEPAAAVAEKAGEVIVVDEPVKVEAPAQPTRDELKAKGWTAGDLEKAEKRGMIQKPGEEKKVEVTAEPKVEEKAAEEKTVEKPRGGLPDMTMSPEQEKVFEASFGKGSSPRALYFRMKNERHARQSAEARIRELEAKLAAPVVAAPVVQVDEDGNQIDPEDKPLTIKQLRELQQQELAEIEKKKALHGERAQVLNTAQTAQEEYAREIYTDFDDTMNLAKDLMQNLDSLVPEKRTQTRVVRMVRELQIAAANADRMELDDDHAAMIAYEIGKMHPGYGKKPSETGTPKDPKVNGGLSPGQMKRIEENTQRRVSSGSVPAGGGKRTISVDEVDLKTLNGWDFTKRNKFRNDHPEQYAKIVRG